MNVFACPSPTCDFEFPDARTRDLHVAHECISIHASHMFGVHGSQIPLPGKVYREHVQSIRDIYAKAPRLRTMFSSSVTDVHPLWNNLCDTFANPHPLFDRSPNLAHSEFLGHDDYSFCRSPQYEQTEQNYRERKLRYSATARRIYYEHGDIENLQRQRSRQFIAERRPPYRRLADRVFDAHPPAEASRMSMLNQMRGAPPPEDQDQQ